MDRVTAERTLQRIGFDTNLAGFQMLSSVLAYGTEHKLEEPIRLKELYYAVAKEQHSKPDLVRNSICKLTDRWCFTMGETRIFRDIMEDRIWGVTFPTPKPIITKLIKHFKENPV